MYLSKQRNRLRKLYSHTAIPVGNNWTTGFSDKTKWIHSVRKAFLFHQTIIFGGKDHKLRTCSRIYIRTFTVSLRMILHKLCQIVIYTWIDNTSIVYQHMHVPETEKFWARNLQMCANGLFIIDYQFVIFFSVGKKTYLNLTLHAPIQQNGQTHSKNSSANCRRIAWACLTILWNWHLKG